MEQSHHAMVSHERKLQTSHLAMPLESSRPPSPWYSCCGCGRLSLTLDITVRSTTYVARWHFSPSVRFARSYSFTLNWYARFS